MMEMVIRGLDADKELALALSPWHLRQEGSASPMLGDTHMMGEIPLFGGESAFLA